MRCAVGVLLWLTAGAMASFTALAAAPAATEADTALHAPYDGNHWAVLARAQIQARYLPAGLSDDGAILRAVADGTLREAVYPSLQLADDVAFITLKALARSTWTGARTFWGCAGGRTVSICCSTTPVTVLTMPRAACGSRPPPAER